MKNIFDKTDNQELIERLEKVTPESKPLWGKMNACQMVKHCQKPLDVAEGRLKMKRGLLGILFGKMVKKQFLKEGDLKKNMMTAPQFKIEETPHFENEWQLLIGIIKRFGQKGPEVIANKTHPLFGEMTEKEWGEIQYKHLDHHLKQFNA
jgi:hypothetical protein